MNDLALIGIFLIGFSLGFFTACVLSISRRTYPEPPSFDDDHSDDDHSDDDNSGDASSRTAHSGEEALRRSEAVPEPGEIIQDERRAEAKRKRILNSWPTVPVDPADTIL